MKPRKRALQIAIDGPSGSGKGTIAKALGEQLGLLVLDTGLLYRFLAWQAMRQGVRIDDQAALSALARDACSGLKWNADGLWFSGKDCTSALRGEDVGVAASQVAAIPTLRQTLLPMQRRLAAQGCVMDGRDIGTVVLPNAHAKFFLTASLRERARRRWLQLSVEQRRERSLESLVTEMAERDRRDSQRTHAPLQRATDAVVIDSTTMRPDEVIDRMLRILQRRGLVTDEEERQAP